MRDTEVKTNISATAKIPADILRVLDEVDRQGINALTNGTKGCYDFAKRVFDLTAGSILLIMAMPVMVLTAIVIKIASRGPIFFNQQRAGLNGKVFTMHKFRSMCPGAEDAKPILEKLNENNGPAFKIKHDPRVTRIGRFLRRSSLDELPQLINVLSGNMSLVGPRPLPVSEARNVKGAGRMRTTVKPGLTCLWQISGRNELTFEQWMHMDLYYIRHRSFLLDLAIFIQTIPAVLSAHGAY